MAKRRSRSVRTRTRTVTRTRTRTSSGKRGYGSIIQGAAAGALASVLPLGKWNFTVGSGLVGMYTGNEALKTVAGFEIGKNIASGINLFGGTTTTAGGY